MGGEGQKRIGESGGEHIYVEEPNTWESNGKSKEKERKGGLHQGIVNISIRERMEMLWIYTPDLFSVYYFHRQ